ncbi:hypothetical protein BKA80DRAFT_272321 [Phyllosticta citrichinensis]
MVHDLVSIWHQSSSDIQQLPHSPGYSRLPFHSPKCGPARDSSKRSSAPWAQRAECQIASLVTISSAPRLLKTAGPWSRCQDSNPWLRSPRQTMFLSLRSARLIIMTIAPVFRLNSRPKKPLSGAW